MTGELRSVRPFWVGIAAYAVQGLERRGDRRRRHVGPGVSVCSPHTGPGWRSLGAQKSIAPYLDDAAVCPALRCLGRVTRKFTRKLG